MQIRRISGSIGAEIDGVDLGAPLDQATVAALRRALLDHLVIFFRDQRLNPPQLLAVAEHFGVPATYPFVRGLPDYPRVIPIVKEPHERANFGGLWHSDTAYQERPPMATMLYALEVPPIGGDTMFANQYLAYERLSPGLQRLLDGLRAVNRADKPDAARTREEMRRGHGTTADHSAPNAIHPVVRTHPETGRKALYVNVGHTDRFDDMTAAESAPLLEYLFAHQVRPEFTGRFVWRPGSLAFWDNRASQHYPLNDYHGHRRAMHRVTIEGDVPR